MGRKKKRQRKGGVAGYDLGSAAAEQVMRGAPMDYGDAEWSDESDDHMDNVAADTDSDVHVTHSDDEVASTLHSHYVELGLLPGCTDKAIKQAYKTAALRHHPDRGGDPVAFQRAAEAYEAILARGSLMPTLLKKKQANDCYNTDDDELNGCGDFASVFASGGMFDSADPEDPPVPIIPDKVERKKQRQIAKREKKQLRRSGGKGKGKGKQRASGKGCVGNKGKENSGRRSKGLSKAQELNSREQNSQRQGKRARKH